MATSVAHAYMRIRYADDVRPTAVRVAVDGQTRAKFSTVDTGWWNDFTNAYPLYIGALTAGIRRVVISSSLETWGVNIDEFEICSYDNRPPRVDLAEAFEVPVGMATNITVTASDPDGDTFSFNGARDYGHNRTASALLDLLHRCAPDKQRPVDCLCQSGARCLGRNQPNFKHSPVCG